MGANNLLKSFSSALVLFFVIVFFNHCSVAKRHYRNGWYIAHSSKINAEPRLIEEKKFRHKPNISEKVSHDELSSIANSSDSRSFTIKDNHLDSDSKIKIPEKESGKPDHKILSDCTGQNKSFQVPKQKSEVNNSKGSILAYWMIIGLVLLFIIGAAVYILQFTFSNWIFQIGTLILAFILLTGWIFIILVKLLTKKDALEQRKQLGRTNLLKMLFTGDFKRYKALFAQKLSNVFFIVYLILLFSVVTVGLLFANA